MVQMQFFIRFNSQLKKTSPEFINSLESAISKTAIVCGAKAISGRRGFHALFDETKIGFWLGLTIFLEKADTILKKASSGLFGYALVLGKDIGESLDQDISVNLAVKSTGRNTGIWCSSDIKNSLEFYLDFDSIDDNSSYSEVINFKSFKPVEMEKERQFAINNISGEKNTLIIGNNSVGIKDGIYNYSGSVLVNIPPLIVRFTKSCNAFFADAYTPSVRSFISASPGEEITEKLDAAYDLLFKERLRDQWSFHIMNHDREFFFNLCKAYSDTLSYSNKTGIIVLNDMHNADENSLELISNINCEISNIMFLADSSEDIPFSYRDIFPVMLNYRGEPFDVSLNKIPEDLMELAYNIMLLGRWFPVHLLSHLFEEEGLSRDLYYKAVDILASFGVLIPEDPFPAIPYKKNENVCSLVRNLILERVHNGNLRPCFNLLKILGELGERAKDPLVLRSIRADILNGTWEGIERSIKKGTFKLFTGEENAEVLEYIANTLKTLVWGGTADIQKAFLEPHPPLNCYEGCQVQVYTNIAAFYIGSGSSETAAEEVRKAMHINRSLNENAIPAFRFFSLINLSRRRMDDALEYINFALEQAEKNDQSEEIFLSSYYASSIYFIYGNFSKAERLIIRAEEISSELGQKEWNYRAMFFKGRIYFETGRYEDAMEIYEALGSIKDYSNSERFRLMQGTVHAWIYRIKNFLGIKSAGDDISDASSLDGRVFEIEAACLSGDYQKAISLAEEFLSSPDAVKDYFLFTEQPDWISGFSQCEGLLQSDKVPGTKLAWVLRLLAQCAIQPSIENKKEILSRMQRYMRDELFPDTDPFDAFYFHAWYKMLKEMNNDNDMENLLSMAIRRLRRRLDRIDLRELRQTSFDLPVWNNVLYLAAKEFKVI